MTKAEDFRRRAWRRLAGALVVVVVAAAFSLNATIAAPAPTAPAPAIVGTWELNAPGAPTVRIFQVYAADGTMVSVSDDHPTRTPQLGAWKEVSERQFLMRNVSFRFDSSGAVSRRIDTRVLFTVDPSGKTMTGSGERYEQDASGASLGPAIIFKVQGIRIEPVPLAGKSP